MNDIFQKLLKPESLRQLEEFRTTVDTALAWSNEELGVALLRMTREVRARYPMPTEPWRHTYTTSYYWHIVPELAKRLWPAIGLSAEESASDEYRLLSDYELRLSLGVYLRNLPSEVGSVPAALLSREACNGNLVAIAIDRLCPGSLGDREDTLTQDLASIARVRGTRYDGVWTTAILTKEAPAV